VLARADRVQLLHRRAAQTRQRLERNLDAALESGSLSRCSLDTAEGIRSQLDKGDL
jgi:hypothetical protein